MVIYHELPPGFGTFGQVNPLPTPVLYYNNMTMSTKKPSNQGTDWSKGGGHSEQSGDSPE